MRIARVDHALVRVPFAEEIVWGSGKRSGSTRLLCKITTESGVVGWGETQCLMPPTLAVFEDLIGKLGVGYSVADAERFHRHVLGAGYYHHKRAAVFAIAAFEMAMWDALGKIADLPVYALWGGLWRRDVAASAYFFTKDPDDLKGRVAAFLDKGYRTFKVKIGFDERSDIALAEAARSVIGDLPLRLDVNGAWTPGTAKRQLEKLASFDPAYVEQPLELDDLAGHAALRAQTSVPIALDESAYTLADAGNIVRAGAADLALLDPHQAGGLWQAIKAAAIFESAGIPVSLHSGGELAISQAAYVHLAASIPNMSLAIDTERAYLGGDVSREPIPLRDGHYTLSDRPGLGVDVDEELVDRYRVEGITGAYLDPANPGWFPLKPSY
jgi:L-alanine-DL-glutamate epimerase-like enolase superfamily enzyme